MQLEKHSNKTNIEYLITFLDGVRQGLFQRSFKALLGNKSTHDKLKTKAKIGPKTGLGPETKLGLKTPLEVDCFSPP
jgi:hypothetical protein